MRHLGADISEASLAMERTHCIARQDNKHEMSECMFGGSPYNPSFTAKRRTKGCQTNENACALVDNSSVSSHSHFNSHTFQAHKTYNVTGTSLKTIKYMLQHKIQRRIADPDSS